MDAFIVPFTVLRLLLGAILLMAAAGKLLHRQAYAQTLAEFGIPTALQPQLAWLMPTCELAIAFMLTLYNAVLAYKLLKASGPVATASVSRTPRRSAPLRCSGTGYCCRWRAR